MKKIHKSFLFALCLFGLLALPAVASAGQNWKVDGNHSSVIFRIKHFNAAFFYGTFRKVEGKVVTGKNGLQKVHVKIASKSVFTGSRKRDKHLRNADFFNAKKYKYITFKSTKINGGKVTGKLSMHGVTKEITVDFKITGTGKDPWGNTRKGAHAVFNIKRSDYGMKYMLGGLSDNVRIIVSLESVLQKK